MHKYQIIERGKPKEKATKALLLLHGRGGTAENILTLAKEFCDESFYIAAPQATNQTWYPHSFLVEEKQNEPWLSSAVDVVKRLIDETSQFISTKQIFLMGFSQGASLALETSARNATNYGGVIAFSGALIGQTVDENKYHGNYAGTKIFMGISDVDPHVPLERVEQSKHLLEKLGAQVTLKIYKGMGHTISRDEVDTVKKLYSFLQH